MIAVHNAGVVIVAAAGNGGTCAGTGDQVEYPGKYPEVIAVASINISDLVPCSSAVGPDVEIAGPGVSIFSTTMGGGYGFNSGTSMATPHVAGTAALVWASNLTDQDGDFDVDNEDVRFRLTSTAEDIGQPALWVGNGVVDAQAAVVPGPVNDPPVSDPGGPYNSTQGVALSFDGSSSFDPEGSALTYAWSFGDGATSTGAAPSHTYSTSGVFTVSLVVDDSILTSGVVSTTATITTVPNDPPVADPGGPYNGTEDVPLSFDGTGSSDPDLDPLTYAWDFGDGNNGTGDTPTHTYLAGGSYSVTLVVNDGLVDSPPVTTTATITEVNDVPVADPGGPYNGTEDVLLAFDGSGSSDFDGDPLTYAWDFGDGNNGTGVSPVHTYTISGNFTVTLVVNDGQVSSTPAATTASIAEANDPPVADPGGPYNANEDSPLGFDGTGSSDPDLDPLTYAWDFGDGNNGTGATPSHTYSTGGTFTVSLVVNDGTVDSAPASTTATITEVNDAPVADDTAATGDQETVIPWTPSVSDEDGDPLTCSIALAPANGTSSVASDCSSGTYTPDLGFSGADTFDYQVSDGQASDTGTVSMTVNTATFTVVSPGQGAALPSGTVTIEFAVQNFAIGDQGERHLHYYIDGDPTPYNCYNGATQEVLYEGLHTHFSHWKSASSIEVFGLSAGPHQVSFVLANASDAELPNPEASQTLDFTMSAPPSGEFSLEPVLTGLDFPVSMAFTPDGRLFYNELDTGNTRVVDTSWTLLPQPFYTLPVLTGGEKGLLGLAIDPDFASNGFVYVFHTTSTPTRNRVVRLTAVGDTGTNETVIIDNLPAADNHNGGNIHFGPDGKLYVTIGDTEQSALSQDPSSLAGKILRYNKDGTIPADNPTPGSAVYALGVRNSFDFTFHRHSGDLWATENGPSVDDEVNLIVADGNYGWPTVTGIAGDPQFVDPLVAFTPTIAPTGIVAVSASSTYGAAYHDNLLFTDFNGGQVRRVVLSGPSLDQLGSLTSAYTGGQGALIDVAEGTDGYVYVSSISGIFKLVTSTATSLVFGADHDATVFEGTPDTNLGLNTTLEVDLSDGGFERQSYLRGCVRSFEHELY